MNLVFLVLLAITLLSVVIAARAVARERRRRVEPVVPVPTECTRKHAEDLLRFAEKAREALASSRDHERVAELAEDEHDRALASLLARLIVPVAVVEGPKPEEPQSTHPDLRRKQILVVDREAASLDLTAEILRQCGARVTIARSATEAILALHQHHDLVVTDNAVPVTEGVMLAQQLRQANGGLPAIVLRKPVDAAELASDIAQALR